MKFTSIDPPRRFMVHGTGISGELADCGRIELQSGEQGTFVTSNGAEYDVARKPWGFYATPSMNARLTKHGLKAALVINAFGRLFLMLVETGREDAFLEYLRDDRQRLLSWLDSDESVSRLDALLSEAHLND